MPSAIVTEFTVLLLEATRPFAKWLADPPPYYEAVEVNDELELVDNFTDLDDYLYVIEGEYVPSPTQLENDTVAWSTTGDPTPTILGLETDLAVLVDDRYLYPLQVTGLTLSIWARLEWYSTIVTNDPEEGDYFDTPNPETTIRVQVMKNGVAVGDPVDLTGAELYDSDDIEYVPGTTAYPDADSKKHVLVTAKEFTFDLEALEIDVYSGDVFGGGFGVVITVLDETSSEDLQNEAPAAYFIFISGLKLEAEYEELAYSDPVGDRVAERAEFGQFPTQIHTRGTIAAVLSQPDGFGTYHMVDEHCLYLMRFTVDPKIGGIGSGSFPTGPVNNSLAVVGPFGIPDNAVITGISVYISGSVYVDDETEPDEASLSVELNFPLYTAYLGHLPVYYPVRVLGDAKTMGKETGLWESADWGTSRIWGAKGVDFDLVVFGGAADDWGLNADILSKPWLLKKLDWGIRIAASMFPALDASYTNDDLYDDGFLADTRTIFIDFVSVALEYTVVEDDPEEDDDPHVSAPTVPALVTSSGWGVPDSGVGLGGVTQQGTGGTGETDEDDGDETPGGDPLPDNYVIYSELLFPPDGGVQPLSGFGTFVAGAVTTTGVLADGVVFGFYYDSETGERSIRRVRISATDYGSNPEDPDEVQVQEDGIEFLDDYTINTAEAAGVHYGIFLVQADLDGNVSIKAATANQTHTTKPGLADLVATDTGYVGVGYFVLEIADGVDWTAGTDDLVEGSDIVALEYFPFTRRTANVESVLPDRSLGSIGKPIKSLLRSGRTVTGIEVRVVGSAVFALGDAATPASSANTTYASTTVTDASSWDLSLGAAGMYAVASGGSMGLVTDVNDTTDTVTVVGWYPTQPANGETCQLYSSAAPSVLALRARLSTSDRLYGEWLSVGKDVLWSEAMPVFDFIFGGSVDADVTAANGREGGWGLDVLSCLRCILLDPSFGIIFSIYNPDGVAADTGTIRIDYVEVTIYFTED